MNIDLATATLEQIEEAKSDCRNMVSKRAIASGAAVIVPLPGSDMVADVAMLMQLLPKINARFGLSAEQVEQLSPELKIMLFDLARRLGVNLVGRVVTTGMVASLLSKAGARLGIKTATRFIPVIGQVASAVISISVMRYIGNSHIEECYRMALQLVKERDGIVCK